jgi:mRNA interferase MazF
MAVTSQEQKAGFPLTYELKEKVLSKKAWVKISQIRTLSIDRIGKRVGQVSMEEVDQLIEGLEEIIGT